MDNLFRQEAVKGLRNRHLGSSQIILPVSQRFAALAALIFTLALLLWVCCGSYTRRVHASGLLVPSDGLIEITAKSAGTIDELQAAEGTNVTKGMSLATISSERLSSVIGATGAAVLSSLRDDRERLLADRDAARSLIQQQRAALVHQRETAEAQLSHLQEQIALQVEQIHLQDVMLGKIEPLLVKGYVSGFQVQQQQASSLTAKADLAALRRQREELSQQLATTNDQIDQLPLQLSTRLSELTGKISTVEQSLAQAEAERAVSIPAPGNGIVTAVLVKQGQSVIPGQNLITLVPQGSRFIARLLVKSDSAGFLKPGNKVALHLSAFPYQKFGIVSGTVRQISHSALSPDEVMTMLGQRQVEQEPVYRVDVSLERQSVSAYGHNESLSAGMAVEADLLLDRRRLIEWILEPMLGLKERWKDADHE